MAVDLPVGSTWETIINANQGVGESFIVKSGTHVQQVAPLRDAQKLLFEAGAIADGQFVAPHCVRGSTNKPDGVLVASLDPANRGRIRKYTGDDDGAIRGRVSGQWNGRDWTVADIVIEDIRDSDLTPTGGVGIFTGANMSVLRSEVARCGRSGIAMGPDTNFEPAAPPGGLIDQCYIHHNGFPGVTGTGGIAKISLNAKGRIVRRSVFEANRKTHVWPDGMGYSGPSGNPIEPCNLLVEECDFFDLVAPASGQSFSVFAEISNGVTVQLCRFYNNVAPAGAGLDGAHCIAHNSANCTFQDNIFYNVVPHCVGGIQSARYRVESGRSLNDFGTLYETENLTVRRNKCYVIADTTPDSHVMAGLSQSGEPLHTIQGDTGSPVHDALASATFEENQYFVLDTLPTSDWFWDNGAVSWAAWQLLGHDLLGSYSTFPAGQTPPLPPIPGGSRPGGPRANVSGRTAAAATRMARAGRRF